MKKIENYIQIKDKKIPIIVKSYTNSKKIKLYFKEKKLCISKPPYITKKEIEKIIEKNEIKIYENYIKEENKKEEKRCWKSGEKLAYEGEIYYIERSYWKKHEIRIKINKKEKKIEIIVPKEIAEEEIEIEITKIIKQLFKQNTQVILQEKLLYWSEKTKISYVEYKIRDAATKYGSCNPESRVLHFTSRLVMLPERIIDAIIVHELCHIREANHSKRFYQLVEEYIPEYPAIKKWLKENSNMTVI